MFALLRFFTHSRRSLASPGLTAGVFLMAYGAFRIFAEYFKEWDKDGRVFHDAIISPKEWSTPCR